MTWTPDPLGEGFYQRILELHDDEYGPNRAALVTYRPDWHTQTSEHGEPDHQPVNTLNEAQEAGRGGDARFALLAIHGWNDYFYHGEFAEKIARMGGQFFAIDLRKYGRAHIDGQMWGYVEDLSTYDEEIGKALNVIYEEHGLDIPVFLYGHSTGGLTATLWADRHPGVLHGLLLNSPWLEIQAPTALRHIGQPILEALQKMSPTAELPFSDNGYYQRVLTGWMTEEERAQIEEYQARAGIADGDLDPFFREGGWKPNPDYRHYPSFPVRPGWLAAVLTGHERVAQGLAIDCPILVLTSDSSDFPDSWSDEVRAQDTVLDVEQIWKRVPTLGAVTTLVKIENAIHDVLLSRKSARDVGYFHIREFISACVKLREIG
ncbi:alpha-beta hydrolase superfamily lysophospholipase [Trueperella bonasi]|uniref:Alpha-beta hydrolase superfamily lysophospholipase n=1 Tax=Trueperella bonasi TaxID=312286 RepID=A0ABT9NGT9_9ACTO|nr:alpha/beta hydrolase [Trueperella bonasi]MDP9806630.1 alpha-beta hydrolase superfamily lysophospholipase [Trueperella bonasi]